MGASDYALKFKKTLSWEMWKWPPMKLAKKNALALALTAIALIVVVITFNKWHQVDSNEKASPLETPTLKSRIPAFSIAVPDLDQLPLTLPPEGFSGKTREAYEAARHIPQLLAQLPCYCYCDKSSGHKSLHSCYETDHSAHCTLCVDEALFAYRLQKQGFTAQEIRERIIAEFAPHQ